jgi:hypothetical protein
MSCSIYETVHVHPSYRYIGMSRKFERRRREHLRMLRAGKHRCVLLQRAWNVHGEDAFIIRELERVSRSATDKFLRRREKSWSAIRIGSRPPVHFTSKGSVTYARIRQMILNSSPRPWGICKQNQADAAATWFIPTSVGSTNPCSCCHYVAYRPPPRA